MKRFYIYPAVYHPEEVGFSISFPDLKWCQSQGDNIEEATLMAQEALGVYLEYFIDDDKDIPTPSMPNALKLEENDFVTMISVDITIYKDKANGKAIKKTLTIPAWLNEEAEKQNINFSSVLKKALIEKVSE